MKINKQLLQESLLGHLKTCSKLGWGGADEFPVTQGNYQKALDLTQILPDTIKQPHVFPEEDGSFQLFWESQRGNLRIFEEDDKTWCAMVCNKEHYSRFYNFV